MMRPHYLFLLVLAMLGPGGPAIRAAEAPFCELYAVGHFGNWYEVAGVNEMRQVLSEAKHWGFNRYADWFDAIDCVDPFAGDPQYSLGHALWDLKRVHFRTAQSLGLATDLVVTPNHVYRDQLKPEWLARRGPRIQGQLICPHQPGAREAILNNYTNLFADLAKAGVNLTAINSAPYDYGGCACDQCKPWILTFAQLTLDIHQIARSHHPKVELHFIGWWWTAEEHKLFAQWMDEHAPGLAASMALHIPYDQTGVADVPLPMGCRKHAFVHIGYPDRSAPRDIYAKTGPVAAPRRLADTVRKLSSQSVTGVMAYSEGIYDDVNKALLGALFTAKQNTPRDVLLAYAGRYFAADDPLARQWADWLAAWGAPYSVDAATARKTLTALPGASTS
ncbi:MAG TPA: hypothetical protein P5205_00225 [Candidatus Paceibacterota bacterium]|nr:hypothetical protein [Verrucomicrobiota bacterium]HSA08777.1 hypothetical protein [Candidatus Paceibacterota bacterium]